MDQLLISQMYNLFFFAKSGNGIRHKSTDYTKTKQAMNMAKQAVESARTKTERHAAKLAAKAATNAFNMKMLALLH